MTWVVSDYTAANAQEMSVTKGQQVEVVEVCATKPDFCLVRMPTRGTDHDHANVPEGLVPLAVLKQPPAPRSSPSRRPLLDHDGGKFDLYFVNITVTFKPLKGIWWNFARIFSKNFVGT